MKTPKHRSLTEKTISKNDKFRDAVVIKEGKYLRLMKRGPWEYIQRRNCSGVVIILAVTRGRKVLFTEQFRAPVQQKVIEFPAGLVNDLNLREEETAMDAAKRELLEETGYIAQRMLRVVEGPASGGSSADLITMVRAYGLRKVAPGGGDESEGITVHEVKLDHVDPWLHQKRKQGCLVDPKIYAGLYFLKKYNRAS